MSKYRQLRIIILYDLPMIEEEQIKEYSKFRKSIIKLGFNQLQFSIYVKVVPNEMGFQTLMRKIKTNIPNSGNIRILKITEKQYENMIFLQGKSSLHEQIIGDNKLVVFKEEE